MAGCNTCSHALTIQNKVIIVSRALHTCSLGMRVNFWIGLGVQVQKNLFESGNGPHTEWQKNYIDSDWFLE